jgi:hypothetical protein
VGGPGPWVGVGGGANRGGGRPRGGGGGGGGGGGRAGAASVSLLLSGARRGVQVHGATGFGVQLLAHVRVVGWERRGCVRVFVWGDEPRGAF